MKEKTEILVSKKSLLFTRHEWIAIYVSLAAFLSSMVSIYLTHIHEDNSITVYPSYIFRQYKIGSENLENDEFYKDGISEHSVLLRIGFVNTGTSSQYLNSVALYCLAQNNGKRYFIEYLTSEHSSDVKNETIELEAKKKRFMNITLKEIQHNIATENKSFSLNEIGRYNFMSIMSLLQNNRRELVFPKCDMKLRLLFISNNANLFEVEVPVDFGGFDSIYALGFIDPYDVNNLIDVSAFNKSEPFTFEIANGNLTEEKRAKNLEILKKGNFGEIPSHIEDLEYRNSNGRY